MRYCKRCLYPENARPMITFDSEGICSGCRHIEQRQKIDWVERDRALWHLLNEYKAKAKEEGRVWDCIIPVSGGKDSHYQTYLMTKKFGMTPLLVSYNHIFNTMLGVRNLRNLVKQFGCHLIRFTHNPDSVRKISRYMLERIGDVTWHYHAGIMTFPIQIAVKYKIPLIIWGEEGFSQLVGMFNMGDMKEFTKKTRQEHDMRGIEPEDLLEQAPDIFQPVDLAPFFYPTDEQIEEVGVKGIYLSNYMDWDAKRNTEFMIDAYGFQVCRDRDRTFNLYDKTDDLHANGVHDYLKYLKFGYGRATDDASTEVRMGRIPREQAAMLVKKYDHVIPHDMDLYCRFVGIKPQDLYDMMLPLADDVWEEYPEKLKSAVWHEYPNGHVPDRDYDLYNYEYLQRPDPLEYRNLNKQSDYLIL